MAKSRVKPASAPTYEELMVLADAATDAIEALNRAMALSGRHFKRDELTDSALLLRAARGQVAYVAGSIDENE